MDPVCPECQATPVANAHFCHVCGTPLPGTATEPAAPLPPRVCADCGQASPGSARICMRCGARLDPADTDRGAPRRADGRSPTSVPAGGFPLAGAIGLLLAASAAGVAWYALNPPTQPLSGFPAPAAPFAVASAAAPAGSAPPIASEPMPDVEPQGTPAPAAVASGPPESAASEIGRAHV